MLHDQGHAMLEHDQGHVAKSCYRITKTREDVASEETPNVTSNKGRLVTDWGKSGSEKRSCCKTIKIREHLASEAHRNVTYNSGCLVFLECMGARCPQYEF